MEISKYYKSRFQADESSTILYLDHGTSVVAGKEQLGACVLLFYALASLESHCTKLIK
jgi:hypothetical protein